jgi:ribosome-associated translation inhibitor RaiA
MHLDVRSRVRGEKINKSILEAGEKMFGKLEDLLPAAAMIDVHLEHFSNQKKGRTHYVHATVAIPGEPRTFHAETLTEDFRTGLDRAFAKASRFVHKWHARSIKEQRRADRQRKGQVNTWLHRTLSAPSRFFGKFRKNTPEIPAE